MSLINLLQFGFMQRALAGGIILAVLLSVLGIFVVARRMAFFGDGIAHASLAGIAIGLIASVQPLFSAIIYSIILALLMYWLEKKTSLFSDTIIGIFFTSSMALGLILMRFSRSYQPDLLNFLFGNILSISSSELIIMAAVSFIIFFFLVVLYKKITLLIFDPEGAYISGLRTTPLEMAMYVALALIVVLGAKLLGVILVSALLVMPVSCAKLFSRSFRSLSVWSIIIAEIMVIVGIIASFYVNLPTGPVIILVGLILFLLMFALTRKMRT